MIHAREDEITRLESVQRLFDALPACDKELAMLENSYHMVTIDNDRQEVASLLGRFVQRLARSPVRPKQARRIGRSRTRFPVPCADSRTRHDFQLRLP